MGIFDLLDAARTKATAKVEALQKTLEEAAEQITVDKPTSQIIKQRDSIKRNGFTQYTFNANKNCCEICAALNGRHFPISKLVIGVNAPPMHDGCNCAISAYMDNEEYEAWLDFVANGGITKQWEARKKKKR